MRDPNKNTRFFFYCYEKESADLKIRLRYDGLKQSEFFRSLLIKYIKKDPAMMQVVEDIKKESNVMGKEKLRRTKQDLERGKNLLKDLGISESDKENIFDMIEMDLEDYE